MKATSKIRSFPWRSLLALAAFGALATTRADEIQPIPLAAEAPTVIDINFPGGSLGQLLDMLPKTWPINIVGPKADLAAPLPPFSVQHVGRGEFVAMISTLLEPAGFRLAMMSDHLAVLSKVGSKADRKFISREISPFVDAQRSVDDIVDAIRTGCAMTPSGDRDALQIKYHPKTGLLLMAGPPEDLEVAEQVLDGLRSRGRDDRLKSTAKLDSLEK